MKGRPVELTRKEFELLAILVGDARAACSAGRSCWTWSGAGTASSSPGRWTCTWPGCAAKFTAAQAARRPAIETVRGVGYRFRDPGRATRNTS